MKETDLVQFKKLTLGAASEAVSRVLIDSGDEFKPGEAVVDLTRKILKALGVKY